MCGLVISNSQPMITCSWPLGVVVWHGPLVSPSNTLFIQGHWILGQSKLRTQTTMTESDCLVPQHDLFISIYIYYIYMYVCITAQSLSCPNSVSEKSPEYEVQLHPQFHEQRITKDVTVFWIGLLGCAHAASNGPTPFAMFFCILARSCVIFAIHVTCRFPYDFHIFPWLIIFCS